MTNSKTVLNLVILITAALVLGCGSKKSPTGGKRDLVKPEIIYIEPQEFAQIEGQIIEIMFSKPIERKTVNTGIYFYPPVLKKRYKWDGNLLKINILEDLIPNRNYFLSIDRSVQGERGNDLDQDYVFVFRNGELQENKISGMIGFERVDDTGSDITLKLFSADTTLVYSKIIKETRYSLEYLNSQDHILKAYIDKNGNNRYDYSEEPYFEEKVLNSEFTNLDFELTYQDTVPPELESAGTDHDRQLVLSFNEDISSFSAVEIRSADSLGSAVDIAAYYHEGSQIELVTAKMDSLLYKVTIRDFSDLKGNLVDSASLFIEGSIISDSLAPVIEFHYPRNGATVSELRPEIGIKFSEIIFLEDLDARLEGVENRVEVPLEVISADSRMIRFRPVRELANFASYNFSLSAVDPGGNVLTDPLTFIFIPVIRD